MILSELIAALDVREVSGPSDVEVRRISYNADDASDGVCFVALRGVKRDGHDFALEAVSKGANVVISERPIDLGGDATNVVVNDTADSLGSISARMYGDPSGSMKLFGITGTNGKTTTTYLLESILKSSGCNPGVIGTIEYRFNGEALPAPHTTPQSLDLQRLLAKMLEGGCDSCAMEVSSHALDQKRIAGARFDVGVFTNLTPEHLDYHEGMDDYFRAKALLFEKVLEEGGKSDAKAVVNMDDRYGGRIKERSSVPVLTFGIDNAADVKGFDVVSDLNGIRMRIESPGGSLHIGSKLRGKFNAQNILAAVTTAIAAGIDHESIREGIESLAFVPGRFEAVENERGVLALVDYSHTPDALNQALSHAREFAINGRLIVVFGCGGDRDRDKRPLMGMAAGSISDIAIVTSDNPRTEDPNTIIDEIVPGVKASMEFRSDESGYEVISDRREAIARAAGIARSGDVIVVAGKGHEDYQILGTKKVHFDDREILSEVLKR